MTVRIHSNTMREAPRPSVLDVLTAGVTVKHDVNVTLDKQARATLLGAVGILAGAAFLAVMLARRK
jgi:hypothetical protein